MDRRIHQRRGLLRIDAELLPDGVLHQERGVFRSHESTISFADIDDKPTRFFHVNRLYLLICAFFAFLFAFNVYGFTFRGDVSAKSLILSLLWLALSVSGTWMQSARYVGYHAQEGGIYFFDVRGKQDPSEFMERMQQARHEYLGHPYVAGESSAPARAVGFRTPPPDRPDESSIA